MTDLSHHAGPRRWRDDQLLVTVLARRLEQGQKWLEMTRTAERARREHPHLPYPVLLVLDVRAGTPHLLTVDRCVGRPGTPPHHCPVSLSRGCACSACSARW